MRGNYDISLNTTVESVINYIDKGAAYLACYELKDCKLYK